MAVQWWEMSDSTPRYSISGRTAKPHVASTFSDVTHQSLDMALHYHILPPLL